MLMKFAAVSLSLVALAFAGTSLYRNGALNSSGHCGSHGCGIVSGDDQVSAMQTTGCCSSAALTQASEASDCCSASGKCCQDENTVKSSKDATKKLSENNTTSDEDEID